MCACNTRTRDPLKRVEAACARLQLHGRGYLFGSPRKFYDRGEIVSNDQSGPRAAVDGVLEDMKGKAKEVVGRISGNEEREAEGKAQQDKADAQRTVAEKEAQAEKARAEAKAHELDERSHQS
jgi:uncharacterized protein YjbJ (UPF0337 family)